MANPSIKIFSFAELRSITLNKPQFANKYGRAWQKVFGSSWDDEVKLMVYGRRARFPSFCPLDGLFYIGIERNLERYNIIGSGGTTQEVESSYRELLRNAWFVWQRGGSQTSILDALRRMGLPNATYLRRVDFGGLPPSGNTYLDKFQRSVWAQFDVVLRKNPWTIPKWGSFTWGDGTKWGFDASDDDLAQIIRAMRTFRSGHETPMWAYVPTSTAPIWGLFKWGDGSVWTDGGPQARFLIGEQHWSVRGLV